MLIITKKRTTRATLFIQLYETIVLVVLLLFNVVELLFIVVVSKP